MSKTTVIVSGGFHNSRPITLRVGEKMSAGQYKRLENHMCGIQGCVCGWRGFEIIGMGRDAFVNLTNDAVYQASRGLAVY
jgi:hypothetical protein